VAGAIAQRVTAGVPDLPLPRNGVLWHPRRISCPEDLSRRSRPRILGSADARSLSSVLKRPLHYASWRRPSIDGGVCRFPPRPETPREKTNVSDAPARAAAARPDVSAPRLRAAAESSLIVNVLFSTSISRTRESAAGNRILRRHRYDFLLPIYVEEVVLGRLGRAHFQKDRQQEVSKE
jgi:hypothetical protein